MGVLKEKNNVILYQERKNGMSNTNNQNIIDTIKRNIKEIVLGVLITVFGGAIIWIIHDLPRAVRELDKSVSNIETRVETLEGNYTTLNGNVWSLRSESDKTKNTGEVEGVEEQEEPEILIATTNFSAKMISAESTTSVEEKPILDMAKVSDEEVIAKSVKSGEDKTKDSVKDSRFILQYNEDGKDVYFYGKYNENNQWDGDCIINKYENSNLNFIMEAVYDNGILKSYRQVFRGINNKEQEIWYVSEREVEKDKNSGETTTYFFYGNYKKKFDVESVKKEDILSVDRFVETIPSSIEGYYNGYTSDGKYNDESGKAYLVKYDGYGNVRYLYKGIIEDGYGNDERKDADSWAFIWGDADDGYHYHKGNFKNGKPVKKKKDWEYPVDSDFIKDKINVNDFNCSLKRLIEE